MSRELEDQIEADGPAVTWALCTAGPDGVWPESVHRTPEAARAEAEQGEPVEWERMTFDLSEGWTQLARDGRWVIRGLIDPAEWLGDKAEERSRRSNAVADPSLISRDPEICGGLPVIAGTRVPVDTLTGYLREGASLEEWLADFPSVSREQACAVLDLMLRLIEDATRLEER